MATTVRVHPLHVAEMSVPPRYWDGNASTLTALRSLATPRSQWVSIPIIAFLVEHPDRGPVLIDTGFAQSIRDDPASNLGRAGARMFSPINVTEAGLVTDQLRARGIDPGDVGTVVMTHLHFDHASGIEDFPGAEFVVERREREALSGGLLKGYVPSQVEPAANWRLVDAAGAPAAEGFDHVLDVFGDGALRMVFTPGHTHGHCSVLAATADGPLLLAGDAIYARRSMENDEVPVTLSGSKREYLDSLGQIRRWVTAHPGAPVIFGHDPWNRDALLRGY